MKKVILLFAMLCQMAVVMAQQSDFQKAVARYKNYSVVTATVTKTDVKKAVAKSDVSEGTLVMKRPSEVSITTGGGSDQLLMQGSKFTMTVKGKKHTTNSETNAQFRTFQTVFESILSGGNKDISQLGDLSVTRRGATLLLTITPQAESKKAARRMLFTSFQLTIDTKTSELRSLRMNGKAGYQEYLFTNFQFK
jgi:hypothetical protein